MGWCSSAILVCRDGLMTSPAATAAPRAFITKITTLISAQHATSGWSANAVMRPVPTVASGRTNHCRTRYEKSRLSPAGKAIPIATLSLFFGDGCFSVIGRDSSRGSHNDYLGDLHRRQSIPLLGYRIWQLLDGHPFTRERWRHPAPGVDLGTASGSAVSLSRSILAGLAVDFRYFILDLA